MSPTRSPFQTFARAAAVALALSATTLSAAPAFAQQAPAGSFSLQIPGGGGGVTTFGEGQMGTQRHGGWNDEQEYGYRCLTNREVRRGIADYGYRRVEITRDLGRDRVEVRAVYGNWVYSMRVDKCTGWVDRIQRLRRAFGGGYNGGGFGFEFNFGN
jgi:hypothetical protein